MEVLDMLLKNPNKWDILDNKTARKYRVSSDLSHIYIFIYLMSECLYNIFTVEERIL